MRTLWAYDDAYTSFDTCACAVSPNLHAEVRREIHRVGRRNLEGVIPLTDVAHRTVDAKTLGRMLVALQLPDRLLVARFRAPALRVGQEEPLIAGEAVDNQRFLAAQRRVIGIQRHQQSREIGEVLSRRELAVDEIAGHRLEPVELGCKAVGGSLEFRGILGSPPILQYTVAVILAAGIVEAVSHLVTNGRRADAAIVDREIGGGIEERW